MSSATTKGKTSANSTVDWPRSNGLANGVGAADDVANDGVEEFADAASTAAFGCPCHNEQGNDAGAKQHKCVFGGGLAGFGVRRTAKQLRQALPDCFHSDDVCARVADLHKLFGKLRKRGKRCSKHGHNAKQNERWQGATDQREQHLDGQLTQRLFALPAALRVRFGCKPVKHWRKWQAVTIACK